MSEVSDSTRELIGLLNEYKRTQPNVFIEKWLRPIIITLAPIVIISMFGYFAYISKDIRDVKTGLKQMTKDINHNFGILGDSKPLIILSDENFNN